MAITTEQMRIYMRKYRAEKREEAKAKLGGQCVKCGSIDELEFDHIDRSTKKDGIANLLTNSKKTLADEVLKCQLLCKPCHYKKSIESGDLKESKHGGNSMYKKGCRCNLCVEYKRAYNKASYERRKMERCPTGKGCGCNPQAR